MICTIKRNREDKKIIYLEECDNGDSNEDGVGCKMVWRKKVRLGMDGWRHEATPGKGKFLAIFFFFNEWEQKSEYYFFMICNLSL